MGSIMTFVADPGAGATPVAGVRSLRAEDFAIVARLPLFSEIPTHILAHITGESSVVRFARGETVFNQGEDAHYLHVLLDGEVGLMGSIADGEPTMVEILKPGEQFITAAVLTRKPYLMSAVALHPARILLLPGDRLRRDVREQSDLALAMLTSLSKHFRMLVREIKDLKLKSAAQRLALYLLGLTPRRDGSTIVRLPLNKSLIAARVGVRPETLSRAFAQLKERGVVVDGHVVAIGDIPALRAYCHEGEELI